MLVPHQEAIVARRCRAAPRVRRYQLDWERDHPGKIAIAETERLRKVLMQWFDRVELCRTPTGFEMMPVPLGSANPRTIRVDYGQWRLSMAAAGYQRRLRIGWTAEEIISAFHT